MDVSTLELDETTQGSSRRRTSSVAIVDEECTLSRLGNDSAVMQIYKSKETAVAKDDQNEGATLKSPEGKSKGGLDEREVVF